eukprot:COSAG02_NODE_2211_length_9495_cov_3.415842_6_plen_367_part_00
MAATDWHRSCSCWRRRSHGVARCEEGEPPPLWSDADRRCGPSPLLAAEQRLCVAKLWHSRLGEEAAQLWHEARPDGDVLRLVGACIASSNRGLWGSAVVGCGSAVDAATPYLLRWLVQAEGTRRKIPREDTSPVSDVHCELLFRASRDGWECDAFHRHCDGQGATVTLIQERKHGYVFGGYAANSWRRQGPVQRTERTGLYIDRSTMYSNDAFLFALRCHAGLPPTRIGLLIQHDPIEDWRPAGYEEIFGQADCGPLFGGKYGGELVLGKTLGRDACALSDTYSDIGCHNFYDNQGHDGHTMLTGARNFQSAEVEVYRVTPIRNPPELEELEEPEDLDRPTNCGYLLFVVLCLALLCLAMSTAVVF